MNASELAAFWDDAVNEFLKGSSAVPSKVEQWFRSYCGAGDGMSHDDVLPEPWLGTLEKNRRAVFLQLNPGKVNSRQARDGSFASQIRELGCYSKWASMPPYWREPEANSESELSGDKESARFWKFSRQFSRVRKRFAQNWFCDTTIDYGDLLMFELYPWHSTRLSGVLRPPLEFVREFIWEPIAELGANAVFAFGNPWFQIVRELDVEVCAELDARQLGCLVESRKILVGRVRHTEIVVIAEKHAGGAGPSRPDETCRIREALGKLGYRI